MAALKKLSDAEIQDALSDLNGWSVSNGRLTKTFTFKNFRTAWSFMEDCAIEADEMSHHPEWTNKYNHVDVILTTHDIGGLTEMDVDLATIMDEIAASPDIQAD